MYPNDYDHQTGEVAESAPTDVSGDLRLIGSLEQQSALFTAIAKARPSFGTVAKSIEGQIGHQKFKYADLHSLVEASAKPLGEQGIAVMQSFTGPSSDGKCVLTQIVAGHGAQIHATLRFTQPADIKEFGKVGTYLRRYAYQAAFVLDGDRDADQDGDRPAMYERRREPPVPQRNQGRQPPPQRQPAPPPQRPVERPETEKAPPGQLPLSSAPPRQSVAPPANGSARPAARSSMLPPPNAPTDEMIAEQRAELRQVAVDKNLTQMRAAELLAQLFGGPRDPKSLSFEERGRFIEYLKNEYHPEAQS